MISSKERESKQMKTSETITAVIAGYGAMLSTVAIIRQWKSDRIKVKLAVRKNREIVDSAKYKGVTLTEVKITNIGHRPVTIVSFGAIGLYLISVLRASIANRNCHAKSARASSSQAIGLKPNWTSPKSTIGGRGTPTTACTNCRRHRDSSTGNRCRNKRKHSATRRQN
jgi:hypothetical protein